MMIDWCLTALSTIFQRGTACVSWVSHKYYWFELSEDEQEDEILKKQVKRGLANAGARFEDLKKQMIDSNELESSIYNISHMLRVNYN